MGIPKGAAGVMVVGILIIVEFLACTGLRGSGPILFIFTPDLESKLWVYKICYSVCIA